VEINSVWLRYKDDLEGVEGEIKRGLDSEVSLINDVAQYTLMGGGKRIRPLLLIMCAHLCGGMDRRYLKLGSVVEFIHTATLLHDDVLDNAKTRRGQLAARNRYGNQTSILVGDFLYVRAVQRIVSMESLEMNYLLASTCGMMTEGEVWQLAHAGDIELTEAFYLKIIEYKTGSLLSASCRLGGIIAGCSSEKKEALSRFGRDLGIAFQVADDMLDYLADQKQFGKALGQDLKEGKLTLPLIHLMAHCEGHEKQQVIDLISGEKQGKDILVILELMKKHGSLTYAQKKAEFFVQQAKKELEIFPDSEHKLALQTVSHYVIARDH
jgi:octaprenyl-diphosphate synthase